jgi:hypothetical protein
MEQILKHDLISLKKYLKYELFLSLKKQTINKILTKLKNKHFLFQFKNLLEHCLLQEKMLFNSEKLSKSINFYKISSYQKLFR